jgi:hypothetical protein
MGMCLMEFMRYVYSNYAVDSQVVLLRYINLNANMHDIIYRLFSIFIASAMPCLTFCLASSLSLCRGRLGKPP